MISEIIMEHLWDKGQMSPLFTIMAAYAMNTFASEALSGLSPFQLVFLRDPPDLTSLSFPKIDTIPVIARMENQASIRIQKQSKEIQKQRDIPR